MDNTVQKSLNLLTHQDIHDQNKIKLLPKPRTVTEVSVERIEELKLEASAPKTMYDDLDRIIKGWVPGHLYTMTGNENVGKCLAKGTEIVMFDGSLKKVENICHGDKVMGPDSKSRTVEGINRGKEEMFKVHQKWGNNYIANGSHILSLKWSDMGWLKKKMWKEYEPGKIVNISIKDYVKKSKSWKTYCKGWSTGVEFSNKSQEIPARLLGIWLGDGKTTGSVIWTVDDEIESYLEGCCKDNGWNLRKAIEPSGCKRLSISRPGNEAVCFHKWLRLKGLNSGKFIPEEYKTGDREQRLDLLAGIIDTDGCLSKSKGKNGNWSGAYEVCTIREDLANDIAYVARSLGFRCNVKSKISRLKSHNYKVVSYNIRIAGDVESIPVSIGRKKLPSMNLQRRRLFTYSTITKVEPIGVGDYYGFTLTGNSLFLLSDFTVTHNTSLACNFAVRVAYQDKKVLYFALEPENTVVGYIASVRYDKEFDKLTEEEISYDDGNIHIFGKQDVDNVIQLVEIIESLSRYDLVVIDHIGYFTNNSGDLNQQQSNIIKTLAGLAKKKQCAIMMIAHLRKKTASQKRDYVPTSDDISGSGSFKQDSTEVIIVTRDLKDEEEEVGLEYGHSGTLYVTKTKCGPNGKMDLHFQDKKARINSIREGYNGNFSQKYIDDGADSITEDEIKTLFS